MENAIAIVGMDCKFSGANNLDEYWEILKNGKCVVKDSINHSDDKNFVNKAFPLDNIDKFDAKFFNISKRDAEYMDPQQRLMLESAWKAMENAGYNTKNITEKTGVFIGSGISSYLVHNVIPSLKNDGISLNKVMSQAFHGNSSDYISSRISYSMNLIGPSLTVQTACSSSLTALHMACRSLLTYECDMALCGGVSINATQGKGYKYVKNEIYSQSGRCLPFSEDADGTIFSGGLGTVVLRRLEDAIENNDYIYAVIRGSAINNDGSEKMSYTAPSETGQTSVILDALAFGDIPPESISYIEAHGTGTSIGDQIEVASLKRIFDHSDSKVKFGSVKGNIGHALAAAGMASLVKTVLCLEKRRLCPSLYNNRENQKFELSDSNLNLVSDFEEWENKDYPLRACVGSLGMGGSNAYVVLEEYSQKPIKYSKAKEDKTVKFLKLSAKSENSLKQMKKALYQYLLENAVDDKVLNLIYNFQRETFSYRTLIYYQNHKELLDKLKEDNVEDDASTFEQVENAQEILNIGKRIGIETSEVMQICRAIKNHWEEGADIQFEQTLPSTVVKQPLPGYCFEQESFWMQPKSQKTSEKSETSFSKKELAINQAALKLEDYVKEVWINYLGADEQDFSTDFFELGGNSIIAYQMLADIEEHFGIELDVENILENPTVAHMTSIIQKSLA